MTSAFTNPFLSSMEHCQRPKNIIAILNLFFRPRGLTLQLETWSFRYTWPWIGTPLRCLCLNKSCWLKILYRKNYGSKSFQQKRKMFFRKFGWLSMKVLQIKVHRLKLFGCSLKLLANVQCTSIRKRGVKLMPASYFTYLEKKEHKCLKCLQSSSCILHPACILLSVCSLQSAFYTQSAFYPWSTVCSLQSAVCVLHWPLETHPYDWLSWLKDSWALRKAKHVNQS